MQDVPEFVKYPKIPHIEDAPSVLDHPVTAFEKLDGGNVQVRTWRGRALCGNRTKYINDRTHPHQWFPEFYRWAQRNHSLLGLPPHVVLFGEWLAPHTLEYDPSVRDSFFVNDFYAVDRGLFVPYHDVPSLVRGFGIEDVQFAEPLAEGVMTPRDVQALAGTPSGYGAALREGVVVKDYGMDGARQQRMAKCVNPQFKDMNTAVFLTPSSLVSAVVQKYVTAPRIAKAAESLRAQGIPYDAAHGVTGALIHALANDIRDEYPGYHRHRGMTYEKLADEIDRFLRHGYRQPIAPPHVRRK